MNELRRKALARLPLAEKRVEAYYRNRVRILTNYPAKIADLCTSHERLRAELQGAEVLREDAERELTDLRKEVASVLLVLDELAITWGDEGNFRRCRDRLRAVVANKSGEILESNRNAT